MSTSRNRPNILFMIADDHRADAFGVFGNPALWTPHFDGLFARGTAMMGAHTTVPICTPARAEVLTGCDAFRNGVRWFGEPIAPDLTLLPEAFAQAGYTTFFTGKWHNDRNPAERGFQIVRRLFRGGMGPHVMTFQENGQKVTGFSSELFADAAIDFVSKPGPNPWFAYVAFTAPHDPRTPPEEYRPDPAEVPLPPNFMPEHPFDNGEMTIRDELLDDWPRTFDSVRRHLADYIGMIAHLDAQIGRILDALDASGQTENTLIVYTSDHGLAVGSHGLMGKMSMYDHSVRVPLLLAGPGIPKNRRVEALSMDYDLFPTLCEYAGIETPASVEGISQLPVLRGEVDTLREAVFGAYRDVQRMVRTERWKYVEYPRIGRVQLFDLEADPHELRDLLVPWRLRKDQWYTPPWDADEVHRTAHALRDRLRTWQTQVGDPLLDATDDAKN